MKRLRRRLQHMILCSILSFRMNYAHSSDESDIYLHPPEKKNDIPPDCFPRSAPPFPVRTFRHAQAHSDGFPAMLPPPHRVKSCISSLEIYISRLKIHIFSLKTYIFRLEIQKTSPSVTAGCAESPGTRPGRIFSEANMPSQFFFVILQTC